MTFRQSALVLLPLLLIVSEASAQPITGRATVVDGDTIELAGHRIRFHGVDAPESRQTCKDARGADYRCGQLAALALDDYLAASRPTRCEPSGFDRYGRTIATCYRASGEDVAGWLVSSGHALDWPQYSRGAYASQQKGARTTHAGIWAGTFMPPWEWRAANR